MTRDDVLRMAREADDAVPNEAWHTAKINRKSNAVQMIPDDFLVAFAALVAAAERERIASYLKSDDFADKYVDLGGDIAWSTVLKDADAIVTGLVVQPTATP